MGTEKVAPEFAALEAAARKAKEMIEGNKDPTSQYFCNWDGSVWTEFALAATPDIILKLISSLREALAENQSLKDKLSVELQALADKDKNEVFYLEQIQRLEERLAACNEGRAKVNDAWENTIKERDAEVAKLNGLLERCQADAEKIAERNQ